MLSTKQKCIIYFCEYHSAIFTYWQLYYHSEIIFEQKLLSWSPFGFVVGSVPSKWSNVTLFGITTIFLSLPSARICVTFNAFLSVGSSHLVRIYFKKFWQNILYPGEFFYVLIIVYIVYEFCSDYYTYTEVLIYVLILILCIE